MGPEGLALARNASWHLLVLDVNLPGLDGFSLCRKLRETGDEVPVIFLTARDDPADLREGFTGGGDDYLTKPFSLEELVLRVEAMLRRGRGRTDGAPALRSGTSCSTTMPSGSGEGTARSSLADGISPVALLDAQRRSRPFPAADHRARLGLRVRHRAFRRRDLHQLPATETG